MNRLPLLLGVAVATLLWTSSHNAWSKMTMKCQGEEWSVIAKEKYDNEEFGRYLASLNKKAGTETCPQGRFVRLLGTIKHKVKSGQTVRIIAKRFLRGRKCRELSSCREWNICKRGTQFRAKHQCTNRSNDYGKRTLIICRDFSNQACLITTV